MGRIIWLASYPKSGNTWLRALLTNYLNDSGEAADINHLDGGPIAGARLWFDELTGLESSALNDDAIERLRPAVYRCLASEVTDMLRMKVHDAWSLTSQGEPLFPADVTAGVVYILRNPLDLAASCANHWGCTLDEAVRRINDVEFCVSTSSTGLHPQLPQRLGSWSGHVRSWVDRSGLRVLVVRYEDLARDGCAALSEVVRFCGFEHEADRIRRAVCFSRFDELRDQENARGFVERSVVASAPFFRRGQVGSWRDELPGHARVQLIDAHGDIMWRFGYIDDEGTPLLRQPPE